jgi:hypothetical protein
MVIANDDFQVVFFNINIHSKDELGYWVKVNIDYQDFGF